MVTEPKTTSSVTSVMGSVIFSESARSSLRCWSTPLLTEGLPVSSSSSPGYASCTASVCATSASTLSFASRSSPFRATSTMRTRWSPDTTGPATPATSDSRRILPVRSLAAASAATRSSGPDREEISTCSAGLRSSRPSAAIASARPASPTR